MSGVQRRSVLLSGLLLLLGTGAALGQTGTILGRITGSDTGQPVVGALVEARGAEDRASGGGLTNQAGEFRISGLASGVYTITVSAFGYGTRVADTVQVGPAGIMTVSIILEPVPIELNPLVVSGSRKAEKALDSPAHVEVIGEQEIGARPALSMADHLRSATGIDIWTGGLQSTRLVARGFNGIWAGNLHTLTDNRIANLPSLGVNLLYALPQVDDDIQRIELVLGPGAALYGPNTAEGVLHIITKSPIDDPGSAVSVTGGERSVLHLTGRSAVRLSDRLGFKISGQYFQGHDWEYTDPEETAERDFATTRFDDWAKTQPPGLSEAELHHRVDRIAARDFDVSRYSWDVRADWRPAPDLSVILTAGRTHTVKGIELSGVGAAMLDDWTYEYYQARFGYGRWFAQAYLAGNAAGGTFMLENGAPLIDRSKLWVAQLQYGSTWRSLDFTYGGDLMVTRPETAGTIHGSHEGHDDYTEYGAFVQARAELSPKLNLLVAGREDGHTALSDPVFSPRAALVVKPTPAQAFRLTYNRAFTTPGSVAQFLDMDAGLAGPLGPFGYRVRLYGPGKEGIRLVDGNGWPLGMLVPGHVGLVDVTPGNVYDAQLSLLIDGLGRNPATAGLVPVLQQLGAALKEGAAQLPVLALDFNMGAVSPVSGSVHDVPRLRPEIHSVWEMGYTGLFGDRLMVAADAWRSTETDFVPSATVRTPLFRLDTLQLGSYLTQHAAPQIVNALVQAGQSEAEAEKVAGSVIATWVRIPGGVAGSPDVAVGGADLLWTWINMGRINRWGFDLSVQWLLLEAWSASGTYSHVSDHHFSLGGTGATDGKEREIIALNAPKDKLTAGLAYRGAGNGFSGEVRVRYTGEFPVSTVDYIGMRCIGRGYDPCVERYTLLDLTLGSYLPRVPGASVQLAVTNLLDEDYRSFVRVPNIGRLALLRLRYEF